MSKLGFGAYRISKNSVEHKEALKLALQYGVSIIDTSSNYSDGQSEELIGEVLKEHWQSSPLVISKVGYVQGQNIARLEELQKEKEISEIVNLNADLKHCIHPDFIEDQLEFSLKRLGLKSLDIYLLHNPEYYLKTEGSSKAEYYRRIQAAFIKLEELVKQGKIKSYGISSNVFVEPKETHESTDLDIVYQLAKDLGDDHHFKYIQFPFNILEMGALERQFEGMHLIERSKHYGLKTISNRPLNCFTEHGLLRLANYKLDDLYQDHKNADAIFEKQIQSLVVKWIEQREDENDKLFDIPLMKQVQDIWYKQNSPDAVDQVFQGYFFPLIANIWGKSLTAEESQPFYELYEHAVQFALGNMNSRANMFYEQAISKGLIFESEKPLTHKVIEKYKTFGIDYILVGMRKPEYVDDLKDFL